jgi:threonine/homoserine/homoserine lactone efflux protein
MTGLSLVFMAARFIVFALYGIFAATMRRPVLARPHVLTWMRRTFAATYVLLAGRLAVSSST